MPSAPPSDVLRRLCASGKSGAMPGPARRPRPPGHKPRKSPSGTNLTNEQRGRPIVGGTVSPAAAAAVDRLIADGHYPTKAAVLDAAILTLAAAKGIKRPVDD